jgi:formylglycine-generating enzyme required for sulfatase activity
VSSFRLDKYLVTTGRFRQFASSAVAHSPTAGSGKHTYLSGGAGLVNSGVDGGHEPGWDSTNDFEVQPTSGNLACDSRAVWTSTPGADENQPINCVNWYEAYAFCIWDGGFLPSEAEWEYAAAGGDQQREYPWGSADPGTANQYAIYDCDFPGPEGFCREKVSPIAPVGTTVLGAGLWGQLDLAGEVWEWALDWYAPYTACVDCADTTAATSMAIRGGEFDYPPSYMLPPYRNYFRPTARFGYIGFRCARSP